MGSTDHAKDFGLCQPGPFGPSARLQMRLADGESDSWVRAGACQAGNLQACCTGGKHVSPGPAEEAGCDSRRSLQCDVFWGMHGMPKVSRAGAPSKAQFELELFRN